MNAEQQNWAAALKRARHTGRHRQTLAVSLQQKQNQEELDYFKTKLQSAITAKNKTESSKLVKQLLRLRARAAMLVLAAEDNDGTLHKLTALDEVRKYYRDATRLLLSVEVLTK